MCKPSTDPDMAAADCAPTDGVQRNEPPIGRSRRARRGASRRAAARAAEFEVADAEGANDAETGDKSTNGDGGMFAATIAKEQIAALPPVAFGGEIVVVDTAEGIDRACNELLACAVVGFDTESRPSFQKGMVNRISLLQLSAEDRCFLFRLNKIRLDKAILKILESSNVTKVGLSVAGDIRELETLRRFNPRGFVDLQKLAPQCGIADQSLLRIAAITLGRRISKAQRLSNWEAVCLTDAQKLYAATDAWICTEIYKVLSLKALPRNASLR